MLKINSVGNQTAVTAAGSIKTVAAEFARRLAHCMPRSLRRIRMRQKRSVV